MSFVVENNILKGEVKPVDFDHKIGQLIYDALSASPDHVAQIDADTDKKTTCAEMKERSVRCAVWMKKLGIGTKDIVVTVTHNHLDSVIPVFATFFVDAIFSAWNHSVTLHSAQRFVKKFTPKLIFTCEKAADVLVEAAKLENIVVKFVVFGKHSTAQSFDEILESTTSEEVEKFIVVNAKNSQDISAVMLSSGSTGFPKGVMLSNTSLVAMIGQRNDSPTAALKYLWYSTLDWISCMYFLLPTLFKKNTRIIANEIDVENFFQCIENYKVNVALIPPILVSYVAKSDLARKYDLRSLRFALVGGSKISKQILKELQQNIPTACIAQGYGCDTPTETGGIAFGNIETKHVDSAGFVATNCQIKFIDLTRGEPLGPNQEGEIIAKTSNPMIGYYEDPEATAQAFDAEGWYRTGDIGYYNEAGEVFIVDRIKDIMKYRNYQIAPAEIEELLLSHPEVQEAAVVAIPHELDGDWPTAFVKKTPGSRVNEDDLMKLTSVLEDYKKLRGGIYFIDGLPQTSSGKVAKNELRQLAVNLLNSKGSL